jgi:3-oxoacyl-[acyl-carrier protein] reductase
MDLQDKVALVTGGGTGLGFAISTELANRGCAVAVNYPGAREEESARAVESLHSGGADAELIRADITREDEVDAMIARVVERFGRLDVLANNAGTTVFVAMNDLDNMRPDDWDRIMTTNVKGTYLVSRAAAPHLRAHGNGAIVNTASISGLRPAGSCMAYSVSKAGVIHLTKCLAVALAPTIRVNAIAPGSMATNWYPAEIRPDYDERATHTLLRRIPTLEDIAAMAVDLLANDSVTGQTVAVDGGVVQH